MKYVSPTVRLLSEYLQTLMEHPQEAALDLQDLPEEYQVLGEVLLTFTHQVMEVNHLIRRLAKGNLNHNLALGGNELAAPVKDLEAALRHLTWQMQQVARGDYLQRVEFMGEISDAFNMMTEQLDRRCSSLLEELRIRFQENLVLNQNKSLYELLVGKIEQWIIVTDADTTEWLFVSREIDAILKNAEVETQLRAWILKETREMQGEKGAYIRELELFIEYEVHHYSVSIHPLYWRSQHALSFVFTDISREKQQVKQLQRIVDYDDLTKTYTRYYGMKMLHTWMKEKRSFILCFTDIDHLKFVNDQYGHLEGDQYIVRVADILRKFSPDAVISRIGGDEFMLLAENWSQEEAREQLEFLRDELLVLSQQTDVLYESSFSYGIVSVEPSNTLEARDLLNTADEKMYQYKRANKRILYQRQPLDGRGILFPMW